MSANDNEGLDRNVRVERPKGAGHRNDINDRCGTGVADNVCVVKDEGM